MDIFEKKRIAELVKLIDNFDSKVCEQRRVLAIQVRNEKFLEKKLAEALKELNSYKCQPTEPIPLKSYKVVFNDNTAINIDAEEYARPDAELYPYIFLIGDDIVGEFLCKDIRCILINKSEEDK